MSTISDILPWQYIATAAALYYVTLIFYRLYLHPLANFPGPKIAAVTRYYEGFYDVVLDGQYTQRIIKMHQQYGPIIRVSPYELHINDSAYFEKLYRQDGRWNKYAWATNAFSAEGTTLFTVDHNIHRRRRASISPFFSKAHISTRQDMIQQATDKLCRRIISAAGSKKLFPLGHALSAFTRDVAMEFLVGKSINDLDKEDFNAGMTSVMLKGGQVWRITKYIPWYGPTLRVLPLSLIRASGDQKLIAFYTMIKDTRDTVKQIMNMDETKAPRTLVGDILKSKLPATDKTHKRLSLETGTITAAAFETTAHTMRNLVYYVYTDATVLSKLRDELVKALNGRDISDLKLAELEQLPYLTAVVMEGLRLSPALFTRMGRIAPDRELIYADKWIIPANTPVSMTTMMMHWDETIYLNARSFDPERWMDPEARRKADKTFAPFSRGTRVCVGMHLAWAELYIILANLVLRFNLNLDTVGLDDVEAYSDHFTIGTKKQGDFYVTVEQYEG